MNEPVFRFLTSNGIQMRIAEMGEGPLILLIHGWPESWYSWRHQISVLAEAGYHVVAPDMRGYGQSGKPEAIEAYDIHHLTADVVGIIDALGEENAIVVGHDWGAIVANHCPLLHPERFRALISMSVPYMGRPAKSPIDIFRGMHGENFFYILYFQEFGPAEAEFDANPHGILSRLYVSPSTPREKPDVDDPKASAGGWIGRLGRPTELPDWLKQEDLDYYVREFTEAGFRGGINYYRNFTRNWETTPALADAKIKVPTLFIAGEKDPVIREASASQLESLMTPFIPDLKPVLVCPIAGHWIQQERPDEVNSRMLEFLKAL